MQLFQPVSRHANEFILQVLGAGSAAWAMFYAIPNAIMNDAICGGDGCSRDTNQIHMYIGLLTATIATGNAFYQKYFTKKSDNYTELPDTPSMSIT